MLGYPIDPLVRETLDKRRKVLSRTKTPNPFSPVATDKNSIEDYQKNISKTTYMFMVSDPVFEVDEVKRGELPTGTIILGNQEYSNLPNTSRLNYGKYLYTARNRNTNTSNTKPAAGLTSLSSEFLSSNNVQFIRHITINWSCFSLEDLEFLGERFLTLGRKVYVEWGWAEDKKTRPALIDDDGFVITTGKQNPKDSEATRLKRKVIEVGKGDFDAVVGFINNFNWTSREDGGFDCTTEITIQGVNALEGPTDINDNQNEDGTPKFRENPEVGTSGFSFSQALEDLPDTMFNTILKNAYKMGNTKPTEGNITSAVQQASVIERYTTAKSLRNESPDEAYIEGLSKKDQVIVFDDNFVVTQDTNFEIKESLRYNPQAKDDNANRRAKNRSLQGSISNAYNEGNWYPPDSGIAYTRPAEKAWVRWGWFEDNVLNKFFALIQEDGDPVSWFRSSYPVSDLETIRLPEEYSKTITENVYYSQATGGAEKSLRRKVRGSSSTEYIAQKKAIEKVDNDKDIYFEQENNFLSVKERDYGRDFNSIPVPSHKDFRTTNINKFIFPGKFEVEQDPAINKLRRDNLKEKKDTMLKEWLEKNKTNNFDIEKAKNERERIRALEIERLISEVEASNKFSELANFSSEDLKELYKKVKNFKITEDNLDIVEQGIIPFIYLIQLENVFKTLNIQFESKQTDGEEDTRYGYLRNIFINVKHLQDIFSNQSSTLGENMNALFDSLITETGGMIDLMVVADQRQDGCLITQPRSIDAAESKRLENIKQANAIYNFPVWQSDSLVMSQELASDISSENYKILLSKAYDERIKLEKKKGISLVHHAQINKLDSNGKPKQQQERYKGIVQGVKPAFMQKGYSNYGQPEGNVDYPLTDKGASVVPDDIILRAENDQRSKNRQDATDKDLETLNSVFKELDVAYTADGRLKAELLEEMKEKVKFNEKTLTNTKGEEYVVKLPNVDDYGMVGLTNTLTLSGIAGIYPSILYTTTYLPQKFKDHSHFYATEVGQSCDSSNWTTTITGRMVWKYIKQSQEDE